MSAQKGTHGGKRAGSGRKPVSEEMKTRDLARKAIESKYGSLEAGFTNLLEGNDPALKKFVFEHAMGKPTDKVDMTVTKEEVRTVDLDQDGNETDEFNDDVDDGPICDPAEDDEFTEDENDDSE